jgi:uncharacterized protein (TIGR00730 family)
MGLSSICVYCGSAMGTDPDFAVVARKTGELLAANGIRLVYGGATVGLMGVVADAALAAGGEVIGVTPRGLWGDEVDHPGLTELIQVGSMHERKQRMFELADAFVALPGGLGTLDELAEVATWSQLGVHRKPIVTLDVNGYWSGLHAFLRASAAAGLLKQQNLDLIVNVTDGPAGLLPALRSYVAPPAGKRINGKPLRQLAGEPHELAMVVRGNAIPLETELLKNTERGCVPRPHRGPEPLAAGRYRGIEDRAGCLGGVAVPVRSLQQFVGDLRLLDRGAADDQPAVADEVALVPAPDGQQREAGRLRRGEGRGDDFPSPLHGRTPGATLGMQRAQVLGIGLGPRLQPQPRGLEVE